MSAERGYRRLLRAFPGPWRERHGEDLIATLIEQHHGDGRTRMVPAEVCNLLGTGLLVRYRYLLRVLTGAAVGDGESRASARRSTRTSARSSAATALVIGLTVAAAGLLRVTGMVSPEFLLTSLIVVVIPGTGVVYTVSSALGGGRRRGLVAAIGCTLGIVPHMGMAMLGLSGVMQSGAAAFEVVRWAGVAYLAFMGISMLRGSAVAIAVDRRDEHEPTATVIRRGILLNLLNPKLTIFFFAFLPQFLDTPPGLFDVRLVGLGAVFMAITLGVFGLYAYAGATVRERVLNAPSVLQWIQRAFGTLLLGFAARLAIADR